MSRYLRGALVHGENTHLVAIVSCVNNDKSHGFNKVEQDNALTYNNFRLKKPVVLRARVIPDILTILRCFRRVTCCQTYYQLDSQNVTYPI